MTLRYTMLNINNKLNLKIYRKNVLKNVFPFTNSFERSKLK